MLIRGGGSSVKISNKLRHYLAVPEGRSRGSKVGLVTDRKRKVLLSHTSLRRREGWYKGCVCGEGCGEEGDGGKHHSHPLEH